MLDQNRSFEDDYLGLMGKNPDEHLLATDIGRDDDLVLERTFAATARSLQTRAIRTSSTVPSSPIGPSSIRQPPIGLGGPGTVSVLLRRSIDLCYTPDLDLLAADPD
jgi:hypothetical protein